MSTSTILVTGATGKTGRRVLQRLREVGADVRAASRRTSPPFDWDDDSTWTPVLRGVRALYLVAPDADGTDEKVARLLEVGRAEGLEHVVLLSARVWAELDGPAPIEDAVEASGIPATLLRPTWFFQNFTEEPLFADALATGTLPLPTGRGREPLIDADDIAAVAVHALTTGEPLGGVDLAGPASITFQEVASAVAAAQGRALRIEDASEQEHRAHLLDRGFDVAYADEISFLLARIATDVSAYPSSGVEDVLGRPPRSLADWVGSLDRD